MTGIVAHLGPVEQGAEVFTRTVPVSRDRLVRYAAASGDFNPIHYNDAVATAAGLPGVIAHGMLTMGTAITGLLEEIADPGLLRSYSTRFTNPIEVPPTGEAVLEVVAVVGQIDEDARTARVDLTASVEGTAVLGRARAVIALPEQA